MARRHRSRPAPLLNSSARQLVWYKCIMSINRGPLRMDFQILSDSLGQAGIATAALFRVLLIVAGAAVAIVLAQRTIRVRVAQFDELCARHRELGRDGQLAIGEDDDRGARQFGAETCAEPHHQLGVEIAHPHAVASDTGAELLDE